jgi:hypothetical protein
MPHGMLDGNMQQCEQEQAAILPPCMPSMDRKSV